MLVAVLIGLPCSAAARQALRFPLVGFGSWLRRNPFPGRRHHPQPAAAQAAGERMLARLDKWGTGDAVTMWYDGPGTPPDRELLQRLEQYMFTPRGVTEIMRCNMEIDVRPVLPLVAVPTLVVHAIGDRMIPITHARLAASKVPNAKSVET